jgi:flagellar motility protein MotE (MotC chaperone)
LWGEPFATAPEPKTPGTQVEFEDLAKAFLMLLSASNSGRLHGYVGNHLAAKQLADERALKQADDNVASALASLKAQEEEKVRLAKATPDFSETLMLTYIARLEERDGHLVLNQYLNNARVTTRFFDSIRFNNLPSSPALAPDQCKPYADPMTGTILFYKTSAKLAQATDGGQSATAVAYEFEEELVEAGASPEKKTRASSVPLTIDKSFGNSQRWFMTLLVAQQALAPGATFQLSPRAALAYLQTLHYVSTYPGMTLDRFLMYRNESLREIITSYNKDGAGGSLDPVLKSAIVTLNNDLVNFRKLFAGLAPVDKAVLTTSACLNCDKFKKQYEEAKSESANKTNRIASLEKQIARLEARPSGNGGGYRSYPNRGDSNRGGFNRGGGRDYDRDHDRDRDRDQDRDRDTKSRKRAEPNSSDTKNP